MSGLQKEQKSSHMHVVLSHIRFRAYTREAYQNKLKPFVRMRRKNLTTTKYSGWLAAARTLPSPHTTEGRTKATTKKKQESNSFHLPI